MARNEHMTSKNKEILDRFVAFCESHPHMRFWQALLSFVQVTHPEIEAILFGRIIPATGTFAGERDTFFMDELVDPVYDPMAAIDKFDYSKPEKWQN